MVRQVKYRQFGSLGPLRRYQIERDRRSCSKGRYHHRWEDRFLKSAWMADEVYPGVRFRVYIQLVFCSLFISADLFKLDQKVYWGESSLRRYRWDVSWAYHRNWYKNILLPIGNLTVYICVSPFSILSHRANLALNSRQSGFHVRQKQRTHPLCTRRM